MLPAFLLIALYIVFIIALAVLRPHWVPALPIEARSFREPDGASGYRSLFVLLVLTALAGFGWTRVHETLINPLMHRGSEPAPVDEIVVMTLTVSAFFMLLLALVNRLLRLRLLSQIAERVTFVLMPPLVLIFLVLGTIFLGLATPTESGAMGAVGALVMAISRRRLDMALLKQALENTAKLSTFVMFILIGSTVFSFTFNAADGQKWVEHLFDKLPGGQIGFLVTVNVLIFLLGMFIDFFEIAFIVLPLLAPVAEKLGIDLIWFGVLVAFNLQTSFLTPPFGFALFYLRSVAPRADYDDPVTGKRIAHLTTAQIYKGSFAFIVLQLVMVAVLIFNPQLVLGSIATKKSVDIESIRIEAAPAYGGGEQGGGWGAAEGERTQQKEEGGPAAADGGAKPQTEKEADPAAALLEAIAREKQKAPSR
jgi:TRAP-type mannitol/chloroaromatic compound transport system permease large subunit